MQIYVDDPALVVSGPRQHRRQQVALMMLAWRILGIDLAVDKGQMGPIVDWIGITLSIHTTGVFATIMAARLQEVREILESIAASNVVSLKVLRSLTGKCQSIASLLYMWRPFVHMFYGAIYSTAGDAPQHCRWTHQISVPHKWIRAFLDGVAGEVERRFLLDAYLRRGERIRITADASPWGLGAVLEVGGKITSFFADEISDADRSIFVVGSGWFFEGSAGSRSFGSACSPSRMGGTGDESPSQTLGAFR